MEGRHTHVFTYECRPYGTKLSTRRSTDYGGDRGPPSSVSQLYEPTGSHRFAHAIRGAFHRTRPEGPRELERPKSKRGMGPVNERPEREDEDKEQ